MKPLKTGILVAILAIVASGCSHQPNIAGASQPWIPPKPAVCGFPGVDFPSDTVVLRASGYRGRAMGIRIDDSNHEATQIDVWVNQPGKSVALILNAYEPNIWNIGWTEKTNIVGVIATGYHRQKIVGPGPETPYLISTYEDRSPCKVSYSQEDPHKLAYTVFGRNISQRFEVDEGAGHVLMGDVIPGGQKVLTSFTAMRQDKAEETTALAGRAGLAEAVERGILRRANLDDAEEWKKALERKYRLQKRSPPNLPPDLHNAYVVLKNFKFPAGLYGADIATFYIKQGVSMPTGNAGHSRVYDMNSISLECSLGSPCGKAMERGEIGGGSTQRTMTIGE